MSEKYDVIIVGAGISGSIALNLRLKAVWKTLLIEKEKTPREKPYSGIQFPYFETIIREKIPKDRLCNVELNRVKMILPNGKSFGARFKMLNFMRKPFDDWLNKVAQENGANSTMNVNLKTLFKMMPSKCT